LVVFTISPDSGGSQSVECAYTTKTRLWAMCSVCISSITCHSDSVFSILQYNSFSPETHTAHIYNTSAVEENGPKS
jgi:hypothetical protein